MTRDAWTDWLLIGFVLVLPTIAFVAAVAWMVAT